MEIAKVFVDAVRFLGVQRVEIDVRKFAPTGYRLTFDSMDVHVARSEFENWIIHPSDRKGVSSLRLP